MLIAYNNDIEFRSRWYHIQTEDNGLKDGHITTTVFYSGQILDSKSISYQDAIADAPNVEAQNRIIKELMVKQHQQFYTKLYEGSYEALVSGHASKNPNTGNAGVSAHPGNNALPATGKPPIPPRASQNIKESIPELLEDNALSSSPRLSKPDLLRASQQLPSANRGISYKSLSSLNAMRPSSTRNSSIPMDGPRMAQLSKVLPPSQASISFQKRVRGKAYSGIIWPDDDLSIDQLVVAILEKSLL